MIHRLVLSNFYSFRDRSVIDLAVPETAPASPNRLVSPSGEEKRYPRVVGLYGPNASGKSTVLRALNFFSYFVGGSFSLAPNAAIPCYRFAAQKQEQLPVELEIEFDAPIDLEASDGAHSRCPYVYRLILNGGEAQPSYIEREILWQYAPQAARRVKLYERGRGGLESGARAFGLQGITKPLSKVLRPNASVISTLAQLGHERSERIQEIAADIGASLYTHFYPPYEGTIAERYLNNNDLLLNLNAYIARLDLGIAKVSVIKPTNDRSYPEVEYHHRGMEKPLPILSESQGTRQFFRIFPTIFEALRDGGVAIIDELDSSIHSLLLPEIISWFWDSARNPHNAQLWFTCQNPYLLQVLEKEEVLFTEKDETGGSSVFRLSDFKRIRRDDNYMKKYLGGAYGALPHFG